MKYKILLSLCFTLLFSCSGLKNKKKLPWHSQFLPIELQNMYLNMPFKKFCNVKQTKKMERVENSFRVELSELTPFPNIRKITYYIDKENSMPFYEIIIEYNADFDIKTYLDQKFGPPNKRKEWQFDSKEGFNIKIWIYEHKLVYVGTIKGTEWFDNDKWQ